MSVFLNEEQAQTLHDLIEDATEGTWPVVRERMLEERGYDEVQIVEAVRVLCDGLDVPPLLDESDF